MVQYTGCRFCAASSKWLISIKVGVVKLVLVELWVQGSRLLLWSQSTVKLLKCAECGLSGSYWFHPECQHSSQLHSNPQWICLILVAPWHVLHSTARSGPWFSTACSLLLLFFLWAPHSLAIKKRTGSWHISWICLHF